MTKDLRDKVAALGGMIVASTPEYTTTFSGKDGGVIDGISNTIENLKQKVLALGGLFAGVTPNQTTAFTGIDSGVQSGASDTMDKIGDKVKGLADKINSTKPTLTIDTKITGPGAQYFKDGKTYNSQGEYNFFNTPLGKYDPFAPVSQGGGGHTADAGGDYWDGTTNTFREEGGPIPGSGDGDTVPAMLTPGEFVIRKSAVQTFGEGFFHMVNRMKSFSMPKFNMGGIVQAFANGGSVRNNEIFTLNLQAGAAALPLQVMGNPANMRQQIRQFEKELSKMRLSHA